MSATTERFHAKLVEAAKCLQLSFHELTVNPAGVTVKCDSQGTADRWRALLVSVGLKPHGVHEWADYAKENKGTCLNRTTVKRWLTGGQFK